MIYQDVDSILGLIMGLGIGLIIVILIISIAISALMLMVGIKVVGGQYESFGQIMVTIILNVLVGWIPCLGCILGWYFVKSRHTPDSWLKALGALIIAAIIPFIIVLVLVMSMGGLGALMGGGYYY
jgi:hypothetical protein